MTSIFQEQMAIFCYNTSLIWLGNISKYYVDHSYQKSIIKRFSSIVYYGNNICSFFSHIDQISSDSVRKLDSIYNSFRTYNIRNMRNGSSRSSTQIQNFRSWNNMSGGNTSHNRCCYFGTIRIPDSILNFLTIDLHTNSLFIINTFSGNQIFSYKGVFWTTSDKYSWQSVRLNKNFISSSSRWPSRWSPRFSFETTLRWSSRWWSSVSSFIVEFTHFLQVEKNINKYKKISIKLYR